MKGRYPKNYSTILRFEQELFHNAFNLAVDAIILYNHGSFPTAFSLAVLSYEELGKLHLVDHVGFEARLSDPKSRNERLEWLFIRGRRTGPIFKHKVKQEWATVEAGLEFGKELTNGRLDELKQAGFYVGFEGGRIRKPDAITAHRAYRQIKRVLALFEKTGDLPFRELFEDSCEETRQFASSYIDALRTAFSELTLPHSKPKKDS